MNNEIIIAIAVAVAVVVAVITAAKFPKIRHAFLVPEGYAGLLYHKSKFAEVLGAGRHIRWGRHYTLDAQDVRKASLLVAGQDVLTADNVGLKLSLLVTYQVADPVKAAHETQSWQGDLYNAAQLALRAAVGGVAVEALLSQRLQIGAQLLARVQPGAAKFGINVLALEVKDVMFPADLKRAFGEARDERMVQGRQEQAGGGESFRPPIIDASHENSTTLNHRRRL